VIRTAIAAIPALLYLDISSNLLSSTLPPDWTPNLGLAYLKLDNNLLTGEPPPPCAPTLPPFLAALAQSHTSRLDCFLVSRSASILHPSNSRASHVRGRAFLADRTAATGCSPQDLQWAPSRRLSDI